MNVDWIFLDMGSTIVSEEIPCKDRIAKIAAAAGVSPREIEKKAIELSKANLAGVRAAAEAYGVPVPAWRKDLEELYPTVPETLAKLRAKGYHLGIIANQMPGSVDRLTKWGVLDFFEVVLASAEEGLEKPDERIFCRALQRANCPPERAAMVGDRLDNDVAPAKRLGMKTVWIRQELFGLGSPACPEQQPDATIDRIEQLADLF